MADILKIDVLPSVRRRLEARDMQAQSTPPARGPTQLQMMRRAASDTYARASGEAAPDALKERIAQIRAIVFDELNTAPTEPGVVSFKGQLYELTTFHLSNHALLSNEGDWRAAPPFYAALVLTYEERDAAVRFFLPEQFHV